MKKNTLKEATGSANAGKFKVPLVLIPQPWDEQELGPFTDRVSPFINAELEYQDYDDDFKEPLPDIIEKEKLTRRLSKEIGYLKQFYLGQNDEEGSAINPTMNGEPMLDVPFLKEDLAVWFGTKKKPKGSKQPKGPWVNICRKKEGGGHPPCGRPEAEGKGYPKCRTAGVAAKMSDSQKRAACQQKRKAEKKDPKIGTGNKPTMTSYKPRKESIRDLIKKVLRESTS
jgi:hypothetical protein